MSALEWKKCMEVVLRNRPRRAFAKNTNPTKFAQNGAFDFAEKVAALLIILIID